MKEKKLLKLAIHKMILAFIVLTLIVISVLLYSRFIETKKLEVKEYRIKNENFKNNLHGYKIVHISDVHYGKTTSKKELKKIVEKINLIKPNILIFTGDLIDKDTTLTKNDVEEIENILSNLNEEIICYSIKGEDDLKIENYDLIMENIGFISLDNRYEQLYLNQTDYILIKGISTRKNKIIVEEKKELKKSAIYSILIMHEPDIVDELNYLDYDLLLAGHTHGGQIVLPIMGAIKYPKYSEKYNMEYQKLNGIDFYITTGIGTTRYGFRLFNPPSFNLYRIISY